MFRNVLALISGVSISFLSVAVAGFLIMVFKIYPYYDFFYAAIKRDSDKFFGLGESVLSISMFLVFPIISFITGFVTGLIAGKREYVFGIMSIVPLFAVFYIYSSLPKAIYALASFVIFVILGTFFSKVLKRRKRRIP